MRSVLLGVGGYLPERVLSNAELAKRVDTSDEWIVERTGIRARRIAAEDQKTSDLACAAAVAALKAADREAKDIDLIVLATATPDLTFPATAARVQAELGVTQGNVEKQRNSPNPEIRRLLYTTNAIESLHMQLRKIVKTRGHFPTDEAATKLLYLALRNIAVKWRRGSHAWKAAMPFLGMLFGPRFTDHA